MTYRLNVSNALVLFLAALNLAWTPAPDRETLSAPDSSAASVAPVAPLPPPEIIPLGMDAEVWHHALAAHREVVEAGKTSSPMVTVIDYSRPATEKRLWVVDVNTRVVLDSEYVAHGEGSGTALEATRFSNRDGSHQSSLGTFIVGEMFFGVRGRSLPLHGLEKGINDNAYIRGLLIHGTPYVSEARARNGTQGLTEGCAGVPAKSVKRLIKLIDIGSVVFVWFPDRQFLEKSAYLDEAEVDARLGAD
jgi:hypothetical protein